MPLAPPVAGGEHKVLHRPLCEERAARLGHHPADFLPGSHGLQRAPAEKRNETGLPTSVLRHMEDVVGHDFSAVRVHAESAKAPALGALAYAQGRDVYFAPGAFRPQTSEGRQLLGHELTHVAQQAEGRVRPTARTMGAEINEDPRLEREAGQLGAQSARAPSAAPQETVGSRAERSNAPGLASGGPVQRVGSPASMFIPKEWDGVKQIYLIDAAHRGDMYHVRAALAVKPFPVMVYNYKGDNDLTGYLEVGAELAKVPLAKTPFNPVPEKKDLDEVPKGYLAREVNVLSESDATTLVAGQPPKKKDEANKYKVAAVPEKLNQSIGEIATKVFQGKTADAALLLFRDSGEKSAVYPELDSGDAISQLAELIGKKGFTPITAGNPKQLGEIPTIGPYWESLAPLVKEFPGMKRDIEAEFLRQAYVLGYFKIAVGFRSGGLDLFTFLGIPTLSISLRGLVGESRHGKLASSAWNRTNLQYDVPRSDSTGLVELEREGVGKKPQTALHSPAWKAKPVDPFHPSSDKEAKIKAPGGFDEADLPLIEQGLTTALESTGLREQTVTQPKAGVLDHDAVFDQLPKELTPLGPTTSEEIEKAGKIEKILLGRVERIHAARTRRSKLVGEPKPKEVELEIKILVEKVKSLLQGRAKKFEKMQEGLLKKVKARRSHEPQVYRKWREKRNWQKLLQLGMVTPEEALEIRREVLVHRAKKKAYFLQGRPGHERPDPVG